MKGSIKLLHAEDGLLMAMELGYVHLGFYIPVPHMFIMNVLHTQAHLHKPVKDLKRVTKSYNSSMLYIMNSLKTDCFKN